MLNKIGGVNYIYVACIMAGLFPIRCGTRRNSASRVVQQGEIMMRVAGQNLKRVQDETTSRRPWTLAGAASP